MNNTLLVADVETLKHSKEISTFNIHNFKKDKLLNKRVLIADDFSVNRIFLKKVISSYGINVDTASDGQEVIEILKEDKNFDLIILDSKMPKLDACKTIKIIKEDLKIDSIPVIIYTAFSYDCKIEDMVKYGFDTFLPKPFNTNQLEFILYKYLKQKSNKNEYLKKSKIDSYEEFLAIYTDSANVLKNLIIKKKYYESKKLLSFLKNISKEIDNMDIYKLVEELERYLEINTINIKLIYQLEHLLTQAKIHTNNILNKYVA